MGKGTRKPSKTLKEASIPRKKLVQYELCTIGASRARARVAGGNGCQIYSEQAFWPWFKEHHLNLGLDGPYVLLLLTLWTTKLE